MKIFNFALLGLLNAQAPSPQKDCTDCLVSFVCIYRSKFFSKTSKFLNPKLTFFRISPMHITILSRLIQVSSTNGVMLQKVNALDFHLLPKDCAKVWQAKPFISI